MVDPSNFALGTYGKRERPARMKTRARALGALRDPAIQRVSSIQPWRCATRASAVRLVTS